MTPLCLPVFIPRLLLEIIPKLGAKISKKKKTFSGYKIYKCLKQFSYRS